MTARNLAQETRDHKALDTGKPAKSGNRSTAAPMRRVSPAVAARRATAAGSSALRPADLLVLQPSAGNRAVGRLLAGRALFKSDSAPSLQRIPDASGIRSSPPRYSYSTHCGWIDWSHAATGMTSRLIQAVQDASDRLRARGGTRPEPVNAPGMTSRALGTTLTEVTANPRIKRPLSAGEVLSVALSIFRLTSQGFEFAQEWTQLVGHSSYSEEDLPSNILAFYRAARNLGRRDVERHCGVNSPADSLQVFQNYTFRRNTTFRPLSLPSGGRWPAVFNTITPAVPGGPLMDVPSADISTGLLSTTTTRHSLAFFAPNLRIQGPTRADISSTETGAAHGPNYQVSPLGTGGGLSFRWILWDTTTDESFLMWGAGGQVFQYGSQSRAYIASRTRELLRRRNIRNLEVRCRLRISHPGSGTRTRLLRLPITLTW